MQSFVTPRVSVFVGLVVLVAVSAFRGQPAPTGTTTPILEIHAPSLTTYLPSGATNGQDIRPLAGQRGTNLDGSFRAPPSQRMVIQGNPFENVWPDSRLNGIRLDTGTYAVQDVDIALPSVGFPWVIGRSYNARQEDSGSTHRDSNGYQGKNWFQNSQPEILLYEHPSDDDEDVLYLVYGADRFAEYKRFDIAEGTSDSFKGTNGAAGIFEFSAGSGSEPDTYTLTDQDSDVDRCYCVRCPRRCEPGWSPQFHGYVSCKHFPEGDYAGVGGAQQ